ncbi:MAG: extracellular solute-binding protein [Beijerinckiaceae bacterium]|nr:extracellular solute-binding protein [Beijerinckiaceae bacterium]
MGFTRRQAIRLGSAALGSTALGAGAFGPASPAFAQQGPLADVATEVETYGLSTFGELALPENFPHFAYVNPKAPRGGTLSLQIKNTSGNQNFETFDTLNIYVFKGDGAAGMDATFDTLMSGTADEPTSMYGLVADRVKISADKLTYRFHIRPEARFHDGSRLTAADAAFSFNILKEKGHPLYRTILGEFLGAEAESDDTLVVKLGPQRSRDLHLIVAGLPIFSQAWWKGRDFEASTLEAPLGSGPYKVSRFEQGRYIEFERVRDYWGANLPVNVGSNNFDRLRYEYYRERQVAFEGFKSGQINFNEEYTARLWATAYDFPAVRDGRVKRDELPNGAPTPSQGWYFNTRRAKFKDPRVREALGLAFDFEWTNRNIMYSAYKRMASFFENSDMKAVGTPGPAELALLDRFRGKVPEEVFGEPYVPPASDGSGSDRNLLRRADQLLREAGCKRAGTRLMLPDGQPFEVEFLDSSGALKPHTEPLQSNLRKLGIETSFRQVDAAQYKRRIDAFDFDMLTMALGGSTTPGNGLRNVFGSEAARTPGTRNMAGVADPAVDFLLERIAQADTREELNVACRALDRVLRAGRYWIPMWYKDKSLVAYWDVFSRPETSPKYATGAPGTWWWDAEKAKRINYPG